MLNFLPIQNQNLYLVILFYFVLTLILANVGYHYKQIGLSNGVYLGLALSAGLWYFVGEKYVNLK